MKYDITFNSSDKLFDAASTYLFENYPEPTVLTYTSNINPYAPKRIILELGMTEEDIAHFILAFGIKFVLFDPTDYTLSKTQTVHDYNESVRNNES